MSRKAWLIGIVFALSLSAAGAARAQEGEAKKGEDALQRAEKAAHAILAQDEKACGAGKALLLVYHRLFSLQDEEKAKKLEIFRLERSIKDKALEFRAYGSEDKDEKALLKKTDEEIAAVAQNMVIFYSSSLRELKGLARAREEAQFLLEQARTQIQAVEARIKELLGTLPKEISQARSAAPNKALPALEPARGKRADEGCGEPEYEKRSEPVPECRGGCP